jgi:baseplate J-like protein
MPLQAPNLDDRTFAQLVEAARQRIVATCPEWSDLSVSDPGMALIETFAFISEMIIYRLNRVPEKAYIEFLRLLGVNLLPPEAAGVTLLFKVAKPADKPIEIPRGSRVTVSRQDSGSAPPVFVVARSVVIAPGRNEVEAFAHHCELIEGELVGKGTGAPGLSVNVLLPPIVAPTEDELDIVVGIEASAAELGDRTLAREFGGKSYRIWREVENFSEPGPDPFAYTVDRTAGTITFAPSVRTRGKSGSLKETPEALAAVPAAEREIRVWYRRGGGSSGNVAPNTLTVMKDVIPGVSVSNPAAAVGGRSAETVDNALLRGPLELHSLQRAVTARDFELVAKRSGAVSRARAFTKAALWTFAAPGTVEVVLVPFLEKEQQKGAVTAAQLQTLQTNESRERIQRSLDERRPLGTTCVVDWARYKTVKVRARVVARPEEDAGELKNRVLARLYDAITPLPGKTHDGWRFGQTLRTSNVYDAALAEPGVSYMDDVQLIVDDVPESNVQCLTMDSFQPSTWYAGSQSVLYRTMDDGEAWAAAGNFLGQVVYCVRAHPTVAGLIAVSTRNPEGAEGSRIHVSWDCGESWQEKAAAGFNVEDMAWTLRDGAPWLFVATSVGLFELSMRPDAALAQVYVRRDDQQIGYYAVAAANTKSGVSVAVASRRMGGVFLSSDGGKANTFRNIEMAGKDVRVLAVQYDVDRPFLWAGLATPSPEDRGEGCFCWELLGDQDPPDKWQPYNKDWLGGSCVALAFQGNKVLAATYDAGVVWLERRSEQESWHAPDVACGLPLASREHPFQRVDVLAADPKRNVILCGGKTGVYRSSDGGQHYRSCSQKVFTDRVSLPPYWLFCSDEHEIDVVTESEKGTD